MILITQMVRSKLIRFDENEANDPLNKYHLYSFYQIVSLVNQMLPEESRVPCKARNKLWVKALKGNKKALEKLRSVAEKDRKKIYQYLNSVQEEQKKVDSLAGKMYKKGRVAVLDYDYNFDLV